METEALAEASRGGADRSGVLSIFEDGGNRADVLGEALLAENADAGVDLETSLGTLLVNESAGDADNGVAGDVEVGEGVSVGSVLVSSECVCSTR